MWLFLRTAFLVIVLIGGFAVAADTACAAVIEGRSTTEVFWYNDIVDSSKQVDVAESLMVNLGELDSAKKLSVKAYGKVDYETKGEKDLSTRLYYCYADYKGLMDAADVRLGRQFVNLSAGSALVDGVQADINRIGPVGVTVMGGREVVFDEKGEVTSHQYSLGAALYLAGLKKTDLDVSYYRAFDYSDVIRDIIGANFKQYLFDTLQVYASTRYDLISESLNEALAGLKYFPILDLMLTAEYYESIPVFDTVSIYSVFAVNKYTESLFRAEYTVSSKVDLSAGYTKQDFGDDETATTYEVGIRFRPTVNSAIGLYYDDRTGYPGDLKGYKLYGEYSAHGKWKAAAGIDYDAYTRDNMTGEETAQRYWIAGRYHLAKQMAVSMRVEDNVNVNYSKNMQGRVSFDFDF